LVFHLGGPKALGTSRGEQLSEIKKRALSTPLKALRNFEPGSKSLGIVRESS
jgi:hypothetical protein